MKKIISIALAFLFFAVSVPAFADSVHNGDVNTTTITATGGAGGAGGSASSSAASTSTSAATAVTNVTNTNQQQQGQGQLQGQKQGQGQLQGQGQNNGQQIAPSQSISSEVNVPGQAPAIFAPNLTSSPEACMGSVSAGGGAGFGGTSFGITFGTTWTNDQCQDRMNARTLGSLGQNQAALEYLAATNPKIADALKKAGVKLASLPEQPVVATVVPSSSATQAGGVTEKKTAALPNGVVALGPTCGDGKPSVLRAGSSIYSCYGYDRINLEASK